MASVELLLSVCLKENFAFALIIGANIAPVHFSGSIVDDSVAD